MNDNARKRLWPLEVWKSQHREHRNVPTGTGTVIQCNNIVRIQNSNSEGKTLKKTWNIQSSEHIRV